MPRCATCTAPLPSHTGVCGYCGSHNDVDLKGIHEFTLSIPESIRTCPDCDIPLQTIDLHVEGTFYIERCEACLGLFFDLGELEALMDKSVSNVFSIDSRRIEALAGGEHQRDNQVVYRKCPVCRQLMNRMNFGHRSGVIIDQCRTHGIWLDSGELRRLLDWKKAGGQLLHEEIQARREEERKREEKSRPYQEAGSFGDLNGPGFPRHSDRATDFIDTLARILGRVIK